MYAVIFRATFKGKSQDDPEYLEMADQLRELAMGSYDCVDFHSVTEGEKEITISYWPDESQIRAWRNDPLHLRAQELGKARWYHDYRVQVVEIKRDYGSD